MWYVYNKEDSWQCGWQVANEQEALRQCAENKNLTCMCVDMAHYYGY